MKLNLPCSQQRPITTLPEIQSFDYNYTATAITGCNKLPDYKVKASPLNHTYEQYGRHEDLLDYYMAMAG